MPGYGNITPRTGLGKSMTIFYAIVGMPLFLLYLSNIGDIMAKSFKWIYAKVCLCRICPGVAKRREARTRRKIRALERHMNNDYFNDNVCILYIATFSVVFKQFSLELRLLNSSIRCRIMTPTKILSPKHPRLAH